MNFRSFPRTAIAAALTTLAFASAPAMAQTCSGCTPSTNPVGTGLTIHGVAGTAGTAISVFEGQKGFSKVTKEGSSVMNITLDAAGSACPGGCGEATYTVQGSARQKVTAIGAAFSRGSGVQAGVSSVTNAEAMVGFTKGQ
ncbi:hypothetical protein A2929_03950 [Candidatus Kaiserbacteria bacterium RIFCSPLOWO2_01_FULL_45_25]|nr:MAG: hypothetical protein A2929_03950 [Candidatus Kaiserbacteria bacterium RIFCSPLOWO2_01_FULL_45_25]